MVSAVATPATVTAEEIAELNPVDLLFASGMRRDDFADLMGVGKQTVDSWCMGRYEANRPARRLAAEIHRKWKAAGKI